MKIYDVEVYPNFAFAVFKDIETKQYLKIPLNKVEKLREIFTSGEEIFGYNSNNYDNRIIYFVLTTQNLNYSKVYEESKRIISNKEQYYDLKDKYPLQCLTKNWKIIDLAEMYGLMEKKGFLTFPKSLKSIGVKLGFPIKTSPFNFDEPLKSNSEIEATVEYCVHDVDITEALFIHNKDANAVRKYLESTYSLKNPWKKESSLTLDIFKRYIKQTNDSPVSNTSKSIQWSKNLVLNSEILDEFKKNSLIGGDITFGDLKLTHGVGGLHSVNTDFVAEDVIDLDVSSYYPSLIITLGLVPEKLDKEKFLKDFNDIKAKRLIYKKSGMKIESDALKLLMNSCFGQFGNEKANIYDEFVAKSITLNGQILLIDLIEKMHLGGHDVIMANTDGISIKPINDSYKTIVKEWENRHSLEMEENTYSKLYVRDVNNYIAVFSNGKIKTKGIYSEPTLVNSQIPAVYKSYLELAKVGIDKNNIKTIPNFLKKLERNDFVATANSFDQSTNSNIKMAFVVGYGEESFKKIDKNGKFSKVAGTEGATVDGEINYDYYFKKVYENISIFFNNDDFYDEWSEKLPLINKGAFKKNLSGFKSTQKETWKSTKNSASYAVSCGKDIVCIDIDEPEKLTDESKSILIKYPTLKSFRNNTEKCAYFYKVSKEQINVKSKNIKTSPIKGAEILYENKNKTIYGLHEDGTEYELSGELTELPDEFYKLFKKVKLSKKKNYVKNIVDISSLLKILEDEGEIIKSGDDFVDIIPNNIDVDRPVRVFLNDNNKLTFNTFNENHKDEISDWLSRIVINPEEKPLIDDTKIVSQEIPSYATDIPEGDIIKNIVENPDKILSLEKSTGGGKTYQAMLFSIFRIKNKLSTTIVFSTKRNLHEFVELINSYDGSLSKDIEILEQDTSSKFRVHDNAKIYLTVHAYFYRKNFSTFLYNYALKLFSVKNNYFIFDEAHIFCSNLRFNIVNNIGFYKTKKREGCFNYANQIKSLGKVKNKPERFGVLLENDNFGVKLKQDFSFLTNPISVNMKEYPISDTKYYDDYQMRIKFLEESKNVSIPRTRLEDYFDKSFTKEEDYSYDEILDDIISFSRESMIFRNYIKVEEPNGNILRLCSIDDVENYINYNNFKDNKETNAYEDIEIDTLVGIDYLPIHALVQINKLHKVGMCFLSATISKELETCLDYLDAKKIKLEGTFNKLKKIKLIKINEVSHKDDQGKDIFAINGNYSLKPDKQESYKLYSCFKESIMFLPNIKNLAKDKNKLGKNYLLWDNGVFGKSELDNKDLEKVILSHSKSAIGTGSNFYDRRTVFIDNKYRSNPKGLNYYKLLEAKTISEVSTDSGVEIVKQNIGRILRIGVENPILEKNIILNNVDFNFSYLKDLCDEFETYEINIKCKDYYKTVIYEVYSIISDIICNKINDKVIIIDDDTKGKHNDIYFTNLLIDGNVTALESIFLTNRHNCFNNYMNGKIKIPDDEREEFKIGMWILKHGTPNNIKFDLSDVVKGLTHGKKLKDITNFVNKLKEKRI